MGPTVVVTGAAEQVAAVAAALTESGAAVIAVDDLGGLDAAVAGITAGSLDCYVQLPVHVAARGEAVVERVRTLGAAKKLRMSRAEWKDHAPTPLRSLPCASTH